MKKSIILPDEDKVIYTDVDTVLEIFEEVYSKLRNDLFTNIEYNNGVLDYDTKYGTHITKIFDMDQGAPEVVSDVMQYLFSMLDASINL